MSESDLLEKEAREMEARLRMLQTRMEAQAEEDAKLPRVGGARWKGARTDKGSITRYNETMRERHAKRASSDSYHESVAALKPLAGGAGRNSRDVRSKSQRGVLEQQSKKMAADAEEARVESWGVAQVGGWLQDLGLPQYVEVFKVNEITGEVLVDLSLEDLDYMDIKTLGHRKTLLKAVTKLKAPGEKPAQHRRSSRQQQPPQASRSLEELPSMGMGMGEARDAGSSSNTAGVKKHWSHVEPISSYEVTGDGQMMVNPGDGALDEEAERRAFQEAVMEWRRGAAEEEAKGTDDGLWHNPWGGGSESKDPGESKVADGLGMSSLLAGDMDEEAERRAFQAAVAEWRGASTTAAKDGSSVGEASSSGLGQQAGSPSAMPSSHATAKALAAQMEAEHEASIKELAARKSEMEAKLREAAQGPDEEELEQLKQRRQELLEAYGRDAESDGEDEYQTPGSRVNLQFVGTDNTSSEDFKESYYVVEEDSD